MKAFLDRIGSGFFVASFIPALGFLIFVSIVFEPIAPPHISQFLQITVEPLNRSGFFVLISAIVLGFTLSSLNPYNFKLFQGYYLLAHFGFLKRRHQRKAKELQLQLRIISMFQNRLKEAHLTHRYLHLLRNLEITRYQIATVYKRNYPPDIQEILPTAFGNIIRAAEYYPAELYGIDKTLMWPRLLQSISEDYSSKIEQSENIVFFVINSALLSLVMSFLCLLASIYQVGMFWLAINNLSSPIYFLSVDPGLSNVYQQRVFLYLAICVISIVAFSVLYIIAVQNATLYGSMIRSAFDLFRHDLLKQLDIPLPDDSDSEFDNWVLLGEYMALGNFAGPMRAFEYQYHDRTKK